MHAYKIETTVTQDGKIILPPDMNNLFNHKVEVLLLDRELSDTITEIDFPVFTCGGKVSDFSRESIYDTGL
jgi:hypothetical protein